MEDLSTTSKDLKREKSHGARDLTYLIWFMIL